MTEARRAPGYGAFLARGAVGVGLLQVVSLVLQLGTVIVLARVLGDVGYGAYAYALSWGVVLLGPATFGVGPVVTRETAAGMATGEGWRVRGVWRFAALATAASSAGVVALGSVGVVAARAWLDEAQVMPLLAGLVVTALSAVALVGRHALLGLQRPVSAQLAESVLRPALLLAGVGGAWALGLPMGAVGALAVYGVATTVAIVFLAWRIAAALRAVPPPVGAVRPTNAADPRWARSAAPLLATSLARDLNAEAGILVIGAVLGAQDVALLRAATRFASLPTTVLTAVNLSFQPVAAALFAKGDIREIERLGVRTSRLAVLVSLPIVLVCLVAGRPLLGLLGPSFADGAPALAILTLGHLFNVACGSVGVILIACRREDDAATGLIVSCVLGMAANLGFGWAWGLEGAALATSFGLAAWNIALSWFCWKRLGIAPAAFAIPGTCPRRST